MAPLAAALLFLAAAAPAVQARSTKEDEMRFAVIGDWGRTKDALSFKNTSSGGYDYYGSCVAQFSTAAEIQASTEGPAMQAAAASALNTVCKSFKCSFVLNTGDNFYECGAENEGRFKTDWEDIYQTSKMSGIKSLPWYNVIGNHDVVAPNSVALHLSYNSKNKLWVMPSRYYVKDMVKGGLKVRMIFINTNPFVTKYSKTSNKYFGPEINATATAAAIADQLAFVETSLKSSTAHFDIVVGHHPVAGSASTVYAIDNKNLTLSGDVDLGVQQSFAKLLAILRKYQVAAYFNGHDHVLTHAVDPEDPVRYTTQYFTSGAGSFADGSDSCGSGRAYVKWTNSDTIRGNCAAARPGGTGHPGFATVKVTASGMQVSMYSLPVSTSGSTTLSYVAPTILPKAKPARL